MTSEEFGLLVQGHKGVGPGLCPAHPDRHPSLWWKESGDGKLLILCRAGCPTENVLSALGLKWRDLFRPLTREQQSVSEARKQASDRWSEYVGRRQRLSYEFEREIEILVRSSGAQLAATPLDHPQFAASVSVFHILSGMLADAQQASDAALVLGRLKSRQATREVLHVVA